MCWRDSGEDAIAFSDASDYAANVELAEAISPGARAAASAALRKVDTPTQKTCEDVAALLSIPLQHTVKSVALTGEDADGQPQFVLALVRGDHAVNEIKLAKLPGLAEYRLRPKRKSSTTSAANPASSGRSGRGNPSA